MAFTSTVGEMLAQRLAASQGFPAAPQAAPALSGGGLSPLLGPVLAAPIASRPQLSIADLLAGQSAALRNPPPAPAPAPQPAMEASQPAGAALPTGQGPDPLQALGGALKQILNASQGAPIEEGQAPTDPRIGAGINMNKGDIQEMGPPDTTTQSPFDQATSWLASLFGSEPAPSQSANATAAATLGTLLGGPPSPLARPEEAAPTAPPPAQTAPAQATIAQPTTTSPAAKGVQAASTMSSTAATQEQPAQKGEQVSKAVTTALPDLPEQEASAIKSVFQNEDLYKTMIAMGAALDSGLSYGEAAALGARAFMGSQAERAQAAQQGQAEEAAARQQQFENELEVAKLKKGMGKEQADIELAKARAEAARAGIKVSEQQIGLVKAQTQKALADAAKAGRDDTKGLTPKDYAKLMLDVQNDMELNGTVPEDASVTDESRVRVNLSLPEGLRQYSPVPSSVKKEVQTMAEKDALTPEDKVILERYRLLYGPEI